ncbi:tRNA preQ1(34) S-adenosylmethionine ribosyltransferase-isomerase QueA [Patescibacteria group bacterium]|nr:tRNA preQ1(34) S-adenosylmethionine ribosyltransferase-isomerase QueA [Patescibacteria group bacterium]MBU1673200.1 tRNA preQ1(34) S-adenosylmethionine ribosyltransferase-isomerase QueA [Patescibacteria group bacterium]MBU1963020.1 tRNA preQ1(34) S-adenosylmethionine ribosyltransferase-isomerase QueA [Patescibacteria group bacterium]
MPKTQKVKNFDFNLPQSLIAQKPVSPRDRSRFLVCRRGPQITQIGQISQMGLRITHDYFYNLGEYLKKGDVLVLNDTKVIPARLYGKKETGGQIEIFLLENTEKNIWTCMIKGRVREGMIVNLAKGFQGEVKEKKDDYYFVEFNKKNITSIGETPTPPYIKKKSRLDRYQTVYAKQTGSVAAPTAGLHFTPRLMKKLQQQGVEILYVTLHVGLGTFAPIRVEDVKDIKLHKEYFSVKKSVIQKINKAKKEKRRIISVGTTSTRTLESLPVKNGKIVEKEYNNLSTNIFISPGYKFKVVDGLITNFHLPKSSLIMLVAAFYGLPQTKKAYQEAIKKKYRFYSFGDAMFIY